MRRYLTLLMLAGCCSISAAQDTIRLPMTPGVVPEPGPVAGAVDKLTSDALYIVTADVALIILQSPDGGLVKITAVPSPMSVFAKFADGNGTYEFRQYDDPHIYALSPIKSGTCELLLIPQGVERSEEIVRQRLTVSGMGPQPPPGPGPEPDPSPQPVNSFRVIFVKESGATLNAQQSAIPGAKAIRDYLNAKTTQDEGTAGWREFDPDQNVENESTTMRALWAAVKSQLKPAPCMVIEVNGHATVMNFPANVAECLATLKKAGGE